ncbi:MAG: aminotransferase class III-fold pyridoxal phosphate-dependent enzyme, partial [Bacillota bacterium]
EQMSGLVEELPGVRGYRGHGLMLALELSPELEAKQVVQDMFDRGFLINAVQDHTLRFLPPFVVSREEIDQLTAELKQTLKDITNNRGEN